MHHDDAEHSPAPGIWGDETPVVDAVVAWAAHRVVTASDPKWTARPASELAAEANDEDVLLSRAERCAGDRGQPVNLVAVDFYGTGDLFATVDDLNDD